ncbi:nitric oxide synthase (plasmid) [Diaphorobacter sp. HDW4B]|uniref:PepSY domain-containing protein n=1 Tax=Diaphorobacter sp. HDW4B TaxID=2714925 RepID=UPI0014081ACE|nr:sulfite reductase flavoprotein subunit alpha [Diaphorobacter sp. HDW4B]QIL73793.1 nitric oxide synthase [Diaphorobacter sp. HDW4B]
MWSLKRIWFQLHWFVGITAGTVVVLIGLSGAVYSFHEEVLDWLNPGTASVPHRDAPVLSPPALMQAVQATGERRRIDRITVHAEPGRSAQLSFAPEPGQRRGEVVFVDPYSGKVLPEQHGEAFFEWVERLHRWLLLPRDDGKSVTGSLAFCLLFLSLSGLYLRWPAKPFSWRTWLTFNVNRKGRPFLWGLHSVAGTWALVVYVMLTLTGVYWAFDAVRAPVDKMMGAPSRSAARAETQAAQEAARKTPQTPIEGAALEPAWNAFTQLAGTWQFAQVRVPMRSGQAVQIQWFDTTAPHNRARNQLGVKLDGTVQRDERFADLPAGRRALLALYPLHTGTYFGITGRIIVTLAAFMLPLFAITGWMLYLDRRKKARAAREEQATLAGDAGVAEDGTVQAIVVIHASQAGHAQQLAARTVARLRNAGKAAQLLPIAALDLQTLQRFSQVLWIASTFGDGQPPDVAKRFARHLQQTSGNPLSHQRFGLLALGDRQYAAFCGFGMSLAEQLQRLGAQPLFPPITMDGEEDQAWQDWSTNISSQWGAATENESASEEVAFDSWTLAKRTHCNPGSLGNPLFRIELEPSHGSAASWQPGALVDILPPPPADSLLPPPAPRSYSVASLPEDGRIQLWVRQTVLNAPANEEPTLGLASGWLTRHAKLGSKIQLRLVENPSFAPHDHPARPAIFMGNGSGYAGLRAHLLHRMRNGHFNNWVVFGERQHAYDACAHDEVSAWQSRGHIERADFVYSRDPHPNPELPRRYVQDALREASGALQEWLQCGAVIYVCGSYDGMATGVDTVLRELLGETGVEQLIAEGRYRRDVY